MHMAAQNRSLTLTKIAPVEILATISAFLILTWAIIGEYRWGIYGGTYFLGLYLIPIMQLLRLRDLDLVAVQEKKNSSHWFFDRIYPVLVIILTFAAIPYYFSISGVYPQSTPIHVIFTGSLDHLGIHHGFIGWFLVLEGYFFHRLNRNTLNEGNFWKVIGNGFMIFGFYLFLNGFWAEQLESGALHWFDPFAYVENSMPFSWRIAFAIELGIVITIILACEVLYYHFHSGPEIELSPDSMIIMKNASEHDYESLAYEDLKVEFDGECLYIHSPASKMHENVVFNLLTIFKTFLARNPSLGEPIGSKFAVKLPNGKRLEPDVVIVPRGIVENFDSVYEGVPRMVIEILSPKTKDYDLMIKRQWYEESRIPEIWFIDLEGRKIIVIHLSKNDVYEEMEYDADIVVCEVLENFEISFDEIFTT